MSNSGSMPVLLNKIETLDISQKDNNGRAG